jgi:hypothetical protein
VVFIQYISWPHIIKETQVYTVPEDSENFVNIRRLFSVTKVKYLLLTDCARRAAIVSNEISNLLGQCCQTFCKTDSFCVYIFGKGFFPGKSLDTQGPMLFMFLVIKCPIFSFCCKLKEKLKEMNFNNFFSFYFMTLIFYSISQSILN